MTDHYEPQPGDDVMIRGVISQSSEFVLLAPGIELPTDTVQVITEIPTFAGGAQPLALVLFFATEQERAEFAERLADEPGIEARQL